MGVKKLLCIKWV